MPTGKHLTRGAKLGLTAGALVAIIIGVLISQGTFAQKKEPAASGNETVVPAPGTALLEPEPTDIVEAGAIDAHGTGQGQDEMFLRQRGEILTKLIIDEHSYCNMGSGGLPCMAMSSTYSQAFGGRAAVVEGSKEGDAIRVRMLRIHDNEVRPILPPTGRVFIPWMRARDMILGCEVQSLMQTHAGTVDVTTKDGKKYVSLQPVMDEVFTVAHESTAQCGNVQLGTE
jgi:hypothetical protein